MVNLIADRNSVVRRQLGRRLRTLREEAGMSAQNVARSRIAHRAELWRIETGQCSVREGDVRAFCRLYGASNQTEHELVQLADATDDFNYVEYNDGKGVDERYWIYADLERTASAEYKYCTELVPGLLQTPAYADAVISMHPTLGEETVERRVRLRMRRQQEFFGRPDPGRLEVVVLASVLDLVVGSAEIMADQVAHLLAAEEQGGVSIRILPAVGGAHAFMNGPFAILDFNDRSDPSVVCLESIIGSHYIERPNQVAAFRAAFEWIQAQAVPLKEYWDDRSASVGQGGQEPGTGLRRAAPPR